MEEIINKVAQSGLITIDLEDFYPEGQRCSIDIADQLWQGIALKEKDFREWIKSHPWQNFANQYVAVYCSADAIIPNWAYMLVASSLTGVAKGFYLCKPEELERAIFQDIIKQIPTEPYQDGRLIIKGCSHKPVPASAYLDLVQHLQPVAKSIMFGEPCSTVPVFKSTTVRK